MSIQRYDDSAWTVVPRQDGDLVTYADHVEALRQAVEHRDALHATSNGMAYAQGQRDREYELLGGVPLEEHDRRIIVKNYEQGQRDGMASSHRGRTMYAAGQRDALAGAIADLNACIEREVAEGDLDGLLNGARYAVERIAAIKGESE
jgi:hypothetical protein